MSDSVDLLCEHCGKTFTAFLHQMEEQNLKVVCPDCSENEDCRPAKGAHDAAETIKPN